MLRRDCLKRKEEDELTVLSGSPFQIFTTRLQKWFLLISSLNYIGLMLYLCPRVETPVPGVPIRGNRTLLLGVYTISCSIL